MNRNGYDKTVNNHPDYQNNGVKQNEYKYKEKVIERYILPTKKFENRRSFLISIFEDNIHCKAVYNLVIAVCFYVIIGVNLREYVKNGRLSPAIDLIYISFGQLDFVLVIWLLENICTILCYFCFILWSKTRQKVQNKKYLDQVCISLLVSYYTLSLILIPMLIHYFQLPFASSMILAQEVLRFRMKIHAFIRSNAPKALVSSSKKENIKLPTFFRFLYFLYIPTAVYRDEYPRTERIRWTFVLHKIVEIMACIIIHAHLYVHIVRPLFKDICKEPMTITEFIVLIIECSVPCFMHHLLNYYSTLQVTQNAFGEILQFGDRLFDLDWWNNLTLQDFYKKWNWIIGDWLYEYVNKDIFEVVSPGNRLLARWTTILLSALFHEWLIYAVLGIFAPITTFLMFMSCIILSINCPKRENNIIKINNLLMMILGVGIIGTFILVEYFARINLPSKTNQTFVFWNNCIA